MADSDISPQTYIEALKHELAGVVRSGDKDAQKAVKAELDRASGTKPEKAVRAKTTESRVKE